MCGTLAVCRGKEKQYIQRGHHPEKAQAGGLVTEIEIFFLPSIFSFLSTHPQNCLEKYN